ncbi:MAG TPA: hypothetical protein VGP93_16405 [Polyangiaceae bacterium]|nr:hypothetical protein [Polyangiaceae bacterium]
MARSSRSCRIWAHASIFEALCLACGSDPTVATGPTPEQEQVATAIGSGDGSASSVTLTPVYVPKIARHATALGFNPAQPDELWVTLRETAVDLPCTVTVSSGCDALAGKVAIVTGATGAAPDAQVTTDANAWHFLRNPTSIAFAPSGLFATCGEARTANYDDDALDYNGPVLWDPTIFGQEPEPGQNGLHIDMLHDTPYCMGVAHERDNVYWVYNGDLGALDRYDFKVPHPPGGEDHSDGELLRYLEGELLRVAGVPSHLDYDESTGSLYVADTGKSRVVRVNTKSGTATDDIVTNDPIAVHQRVEGTHFDEVVSADQLQSPSGLVLYQGVLFVTDNATSSVLAFTLEGKLLRRLDTGLPPGSLSGITIGPDGRAFLADLATAEVFRVDLL